MVIIILTLINKSLWSITIVLLIFSGLYFTWRLKFIQFRIKDMFKGFKNRESSAASPFKVLMLTLGARIGIGSLAGVALAIYIGGPGTVFWLWIATIIVASNAYVESYLGVLFHEKHDGFNRGGPSYYIDKGLNNKALAKIYSIIVLITYILGFLTIQANTIAKSFQNFNNSNPLVIGILLAIISGFVIIRGTKGIIDVSSKIMPFIGILYIAVSIYVLGSNLDRLPDIFCLIITGAFDFKSVGMGILTPFIIGFQRGIFSNEAGVGSGAIAASTVDNDDARGQGMIQVAGIYFTTLVLCTITAFMVLLSNYQGMNLENINGIELTQYAFNYHLGNYGGVVLMITIFIFAFSTIISGYYYGETSFKYLKKDATSKEIMILKIITLILLIGGSIANSLFLWNLVDIFVAIMGMINIYAIFKLRSKVK